MNDDIGEDWTNTLHSLQDEAWTAYAGALERMARATEIGRRQYAWPLHYRHGIAVVRTGAPNVGRLLAKYQELSSEFGGKGYRGPSTAQQEALLKQWKALAKADATDLQSVRDAVDDVYDAMWPLSIDETKPPSPSERKLMAVMQDLISNHQSSLGDVSAALQRHGFR